MRFAAPALACLLLVAGLAAGVGTPVAGTSTGGGSERVDLPPGELGVEYVVARTPDDPGHVDVTVQFTLPASVGELTARPAGDTTLASAEGFERGDTLQWDGTTRTPTFTVRKPVNVTVERATRDGPADGFLYADVGEWALIRSPSIAFRYGASEELAVNRTVTVDGPGVAGGSMVFLGNHTVHERRVAGQRLRLVVPRAANLTESPTAILDTVGEASTRLAFGRRDPTVTMVAAPTDGVGWGSTGLQRGRADFWVRDRQALDTAENVWVHEYVHTRQSHRTSAETAWTSEAAADYYAALFAYESGSLPYDEFRVHLREGRAKRYGDAVLAEPETWHGTLANYVKGALVLGAVDRQIRLESGSEATLQDVFRAANDESRLGEDELLAAIEAAGGEESRAFAARHTRTTEPPAVWNRSEHRTAFGPTATFRYAFDDAFGVTGPYRTARLDGPVVPNETVRVRAEVRNVGDTDGTFDATLFADGERVDERTGSLAPDTTRALTFRLPVESVPEDGRLSIRLGNASAAVSVEPPASPSVVDLTVPARVPADEPFLARATLRNPADRPAERRVTVSVDGDPVANRTVTLAPGAETTVEQRLTLPAGPHEVAVGDRTARVEAAATSPTASPTPSPTTAPTRTPTAEAGPGFGAGLALAGLLGWVALAARRCWIYDNGGRS